MKKSFKKILFSLLAVWFVFPALAQEPAPTKELPIDPNVIYGKLDNGMTYYIRHNEKPAERAEFYLINNVGAILETDAQNGLAHFCEHMAFNGTKNFPKKGVLEFMERNGVKFGHNVNAFTSTDVTAYMLSKVPTNNKAIVDTALLVLYDWSHNVSFEEEEIDAERGVIHEEWRTGRRAAFRMRRELSPIIYKGSKYAKRDVIGDIDVIDNCEYETMRSFYRDWYRPDLQAIVVVGDFDVKKMEKQVKKLFSKVPEHKNPKPRPKFELPDHEGTIVGIATDKEAQNTRVMVYYKHETTPAEKKNIDYYRSLVLRNLYQTMIGTRFSELLQEENPPFIYAFAQYGSFVRTKDAYITLVGAKNNEATQGLKAALLVNERVKRFGFTKSELDRAKKQLMRQVEKQYKDAGNQKSQRYVWEYMSHFLTNEPAPGIEFEYKYMKEELPKIQLDEINALAKNWITDENIVITVTGPDKEGVEIPTKDEVLNVVEEVKQAKLEAYKDEVSGTELLAEKPTPSKITQEATNEELGVTEWILENGVRVVLKPTDFKEDEIMLTAFSPGGSSLLPLDDEASAQMFTGVMLTSGVADFDAIALNKMLSGKIVSLQPYVSQLTEGFRGSASPDDLESMMQLIYLYFTNPRHDPTAFNAYMTRFKAYVENRSSDPNQRFNDSIQVIKADHHPRQMPFNSEFMEKVDFESIAQIHKDRFADASDFTFIFVGNIDIAKIKELAQTYLGSLPSTGRKEHWKDLNIKPPKGVVEKEIELPMETPKSTVYVNFNGDFEYTKENLMIWNAIVHVLQLRYTETIREKQGGSYGVAVWDEQDKFPKSRYQLNIKFDCAPEKAQELKKIVYQEIEKLAKKGPSEKDLNKAKEYFLKTYDESIKENRFWLNNLQTMYFHDMPIKPGSYKDRVKALTTKQVKKAAKKWLKPKQHFEIVMKPAK